MQLKESEDKYLRALAELENSKKRYEKMQIDVAKYSIAYFVIMLPFIYVQIKTIIYFFKLYKKFSF